MVPSQHCLVECSFLKARAIYIKLLLINIIVVKKEIISVQNDVFSLQHNTTTAHQSWMIEIITDTV